MKWSKYLLVPIGLGIGIGAAYFYPANSFIAFVIGWLFLLPAVFLVYMVYGLRMYMQERKNRITVTMKPTEAMRALARREQALNKEKQLLYEEMEKEIKSKKMD